MGIVTADISTTIDGFGAGPGQCLQRPFGDVDEGPLHGWMFDHRDDHRAEVEAILDAGASTINAVMAAGWLDELRWHVVPSTSGLGGPAGHTGSRLFDGVPQTGLVPVAVRQTPHVTHLTYRRA